MQNTMPSMQQHNADHLLNTPHIPIYIHLFLNCRNRTARIRQLTATSTINLANCCRYTGRKCLQ